MDNIEQDARTVAVKACSACTGGLLERDKYCRWCGALQPIIENRLNNENCGTEQRWSGEDCGITHGLTLPTGSGEIPNFVSITVALPPNVRSDVYRRISGPLVSALVSGALSTPLPERRSLLLQRVTLALISVPISLMIVLLSPLDAYAAVKNLARQV